jgi:hypothetical protein
MDEGAAAADADASLLAFLGPPGAADAGAEVSVGKRREHSGELAFQAPPYVFARSVQVVSAIDNLH